MGMRTAHQVDPKAQLVVSTSHSAQDNGYTSGEDSAALDSTSLGSQAESSELKGLTTDSDVLSAPRMVEGSGGMVERPLGGLEQAVLLGFAQQVKKGTSADELQVWVSKLDINLLQSELVFTYNKIVFAGVANGTIRRGSPAAAAQPSCHQSLSKAAPGSPRAHSHSHPRALPHAPAAAG